VLLSHVSPFYTILTQNLHIYPIILIMALFLSKYINKIDKKGRISVPASFRSVLQEQSSFAGIVVYPSFVNECVEGVSLARIEHLSKIIDQLDPYSQEREAFATAILAGSVQLYFDTEGRIQPPEELLQNIGISDQVCFVGKGESFEIWQPEKFAKYLEESRDLAKNNRGLLKNK
jgi:MraZ protein